MGWFFIGVLLFAIVGDFAKIMTHFNHNEHMYITAGVLVSQNKVLYRDFAYLQMPYLPLLYGGLYQLLGIDSHYYLAGKLVSFLALAGSAWVLFLITRRVLGESNIASGLAALFLLNMSIVGPAREVSNYILPVFLSFLAVFLFESAHQQPNKQPLLMMLAGLMLAFAVGVKLTYAAIVFPFLAVIGLQMLLNSKLFLTTIARQFLPLLAGLWIGLLPIAGFIIRDPAVFIFNNWGYHTINTQWRFLTGYTGTMSLSSKLIFAGETFLKTDNLILLSGVTLGVAFSLLDFRRTKKISMGLVLALFLFITGILTALAPTPSFSQYYTIPISFLFILLVYSWGVKINGTFRPQRMAILFMVLASLVNVGMAYIESISDLRYREKWSALYIHDVSTKIRKVLHQKDAGMVSKVATLSPLFAVEAGLPIYPELASGPFLYRVGDLLTAEQRNYLIASSPNTIKLLFETDPPIAILTSFYGELERPLVEFALQNGYKEIELPNFEGKLHLFQP